MRSRVFHSGEPAADVEFCLVFPRESLSIPVMRRVLGDTLGQLGIDQSCINDLLLAVTEACTNVLRHSGPGLRYEVTAEVGRHHCMLEVVDNGRGFDTAVLPVNGATVRNGRLRRRRPPAQWAFPPPSASSAMRNRLSRGRRRSEARILAQLPESGRGLAIMRACVDDVTLRSRPGSGTVVSLQKRIELRSDAPLAQLEAIPLRDAG